MHDQPCILGEKTGEQDRATTALHVELIPSIVSIYMVCQLQRAV